MISELDLETTDDYDHVVKQIDSKHRIIRCKDNIQYISQFKDGYWKGESYFTTLSGAKKQRSPFYPSSCELFPEYIPSVEIKNPVFSDVLVLEYRLRYNKTRPGDRKDKATKCEIFLNGRMIGLGNSAAADGARLLLQLGYSPDQLMTTREMSSDCCSWKPAKISAFAKWRLTTETSLTDDKLKAKKHRPWVGL